MNLDLYLSVGYHCAGSENFMEMCHINIQVYILFVYG
jgi:hypothetical protein